MIVSILAQQPTGPEFGKSSPIGLVILVALLVGTALLIWSMNKKIKRLPATFEKEDPTLDQALDEGTDRGGITPSPQPDTSRPKPAVPDEP
ncbi:hypothetical protein HQO38_10215 [Rhodococcus fascians]|jgi:hypothetical protein|uniref:Uncharacterized protein n=2 Tax=root TaxID=1 RepID=A0A143QGN7_RHOFA|nr:MULTISPECIES: hypothetical protein [Rhodococcus]MSX07159.1 hypothetical protein [Actinomycetota bacterium]AMY21642.1 hypothetical protein A3Q41_00318 [Rhodococcus fascians]AMY54338.1 hypothetical protein A3L23_03005 [Rhodococcus fascians D188]KMJ51133.1 hypothetical protein ACG96_00960 [Rhodococcus fascians]MBJ7321194.1 hypothetical protein [Rhodococcus sp. (in: high G+C Gram-positive bacteria)]